MIYIHQEDLTGCGIACLANLASMDYQSVKQMFEKKFYKIDKGIKVFDMVEFLNDFGLDYKLKFFNHNRFNSREAKKYSQITNSITLIRKNKTYPLGHYLLRVEDGWVDPWINLPSIHSVHAGVRDKLPGYPWYVIYPASYTLK